MVEMQKGIAALEDSLAGFTKLNILLPYDPANHGPWYLLKKKLNTFTCT